MVLSRRCHHVPLHHPGARRQLRDQTKIVKIENGQEKVDKLRYGAEPFRPPGLEEPLLLLTSVGRVPDSRSLWWIAQIYRTRWKI